MFLLKFSTFSAILRIFAIQSEPQQYVILLSLSNNYVLEDITIKFQVHKKKLKQHIDRQTCRQIYRQIDMKAAKFLVHRHIYRKPIAYYVASFCIVYTIAHRLWQSKPLTFIFTFDFSTFPSSWYLQTTLRVSTMH